MISNAWRRVGEGYENYVVPCQCMGCRGNFVWSEGQRFCPICGVELIREIPRNEDRLELRRRVGWRDYHREEERKRRGYGYRIEMIPDFQEGESWQEVGWEYRAGLGEFRLALEGWRHYLSRGHWFSRRVRMVAVGLTGERVILGPVHVSVAPPTTGN